MTKRNIKPVPNPEELVIKPDHYDRWPVEPISVIMENDFEFWRGSIIKYAARAGYKIYDGKDAVQSEITDLRKARRFAQMRINQLEGKPVTDVDKDTPE